MVKLPESHLARNQSHVDYEFQQQDSGFGQHDFE